MGKRKLCQVVLRPISVVLQLCSDSVGEAMPLITAIARIAPGPHRFPSACSAKRRRLSKSR